MCNSLHKDSLPIAPIGKGFKIFRKNINGDLVPMMCRSFRCYQPDNNKSINPWIKWNFDDLPETGFCFIPNWSDVMFLFIKWTFLFSNLDNYVIREIEYRKGLGSHYELITDESKTRIALCKEFRIIDAR